MAHIYPRHTVNLDGAAYRTWWRLWRQGALVDGPRVAQFERQWRDFIRAGDAVAVSSARAGFYFALKALGIRAGHEVIVPAYTFPAMPAVVAATGARPVFVDVDPETFNLDPNLAAAAVTRKTSAIVVAHLFGRVADMPAFTRLAAGKGLILIEDAAHAAGAVQGGRRAGSFGDVGLFSFGVGKNMPCFGGGAVTFRDPGLAAKVRTLVGGGGPRGGWAISRKVLSTLPAWFATRRSLFPWTLYPATRVLSALGSTAIDRSVEEPLSQTTQWRPTGATGARMTNLQAAVGLQQLKRLPGINAALAHNGWELAGRLADVEGIKAPAQVGDGEHLYLYFRILAPEAARFRRMLLRYGVDTQPDDMRNCAGLEEFADYAVGARCPVAAGLPEKSIELPNNISMTADDLDYVALAVRDVAEEIGRGHRGHRGHRGRAR